MIDYKIGTSTIQYIKNTKKMLATWETAKEFSQETQYSLNPVGGHCWWLYYLRNTKEKNIFLN